jgi:hypothetical protein
MNDWPDQSQAIDLGEAAFHIAARVAHEANRAYCAHLGDDSQLPWFDTPEEIQQSAIEGVRAIWEKPSLTPAEQHEEWCRFKLDHGWVYGEEKSLEKKTHHCLVPYDKLSPEQQLKDALFGAVVRAVLGLPS